MILKQIPGGFYHILGNKVLYTIYHYLPKRNYFTEGSVYFKKIFVTRLEEKKTKLYLYTIDLKNIPTPFREIFKDLI